MMCTIGPPMSPVSHENRYLVAALEFEGVLRACLHRYARNAADVDELLQETYAHLLSAGAAKGREEVRSIRAFALTVARNVALSWLRHRQVVPIELVADLEALELLDETGQVDEIVNTHQELALLTAAVASLPARCRQVFTLRKVYGLSQKEIAAELSISENTVEQHLAKGMRLCSAALANSPMAERRSPWLERAKRRADARDLGTADARDLGTADARGLSTADARSPSTPELVIANE
jgi:RNA polymerase sigma factor (sigma-70 family)